MNWQRLATLQQPALDRKTRVGEIEDRDHFAQLLWTDQLGVDAGHAHGVAAAREGVALRVGVEQVDHAALGYHGVEVEITLQPFP